MSSPDVPLVLLSKQSSVSWSIQTTMTQQHWPNQRRTLGQDYRIIRPIVDGENVCWGIPFKNLLNYLANVQMKCI